MEVDADTDNGMRSGKLEDVGGKVRHEICSEPAVGGGKQEIGVPENQQETTASGNPENVAPGKDKAEKGSTATSTPPPVNIKKMFRDDDAMEVDANQVLSTPRCWKCFLFNPFFTCNSCGKNFHRNCAFIQMHPNPIFDKSIEKASSAKWGKVRMLKCSICIVSEITQIKHLGKVPVTVLNNALYLTAVFMEEQRAGNMLKTYPNGMTLAKIKEKALTEQYRTVEGFYADFRKIAYDVICQRGIHDEPTTVAYTVLKALGLELEFVMACIQCRIRAIDTTGKYLNAKLYTNEIVRTCEVPHIVVWEKEGDYPYWPAKVLAINVQENTVIIQCFGHNGQPRKVPLFSNLIEYKFYSMQYPSKNAKKLGKSWQNAKLGCDLYFKNLREKFGQDGVLIPEQAEAFDGNLEAATKKMFPLYTPSDPSK